MKILIDDFKRYKSYRKLIDIYMLYLSSKAFQAVLLFRISSFFYKNKMNKLAILLKNKSIRKTGCEIGESTKIDYGLKIAHPVGIVISGGATIGKNVTLQSGVVIGTNRDEIDKYPRIGNNVYIGAGAKILGNISIGDNVIIGANAVVINNIDDNKTVVGIPSRSIN